MATQAYNVIIRHIATGCDFRIRLFAKDWETAAERAADRARFAERITPNAYRDLRAKGNAVFRVVSCEVSEDQTRPLSF